MENPKYILPNLPKTATVSYYAPKEQEINPIIVGGSYRSWKAETNEFAFGPMPNNNESETFMTLRISCPGSGCSNRTVSNWYHVSDGGFTASSQSGCGSLEMSDQARIKCKGCGTVGSAGSWSFSCSDHSGEYKSVSSSSLATAL